MNGDSAFAEGLAKGVFREVTGIPHDFLICPPFLHLAKVNEMIGENALMLGAQDCSHEENGAHTGDISANMLVDIGCTHVILGHSERRQNHKESSELVAKKSEKALAAGLKVILCVGETEAERDAGQEKEIVYNQLFKSMLSQSNAENTIIAYEPVWAIGTGKTASLDDIAAMHGFIKENLAPKGDFRILYGGSVKPENAKDILGLDGVDGALIGGASLKAESFLGIARAI